MSISSCSPSPHTNLASHNSLEIDTGSFIPNYHPLINRFHFHLWVQWQKKKRCLSPCRIPRGTCLKKTPVARIPKRHGSCSHEAGDWGPKLDISILLLMISKDSTHWKPVVSCQCPLASPLINSSIQWGSNTWRERRGFLRTYGRKGSFVCPLKRQMACLPPPTPLLRQWSRLVGGSETIQALTNPRCHSELGGNKGLRAWKLKHDF